MVSSFAYPDLRIDNLVPGWSATGRTSYVACSSGDFEIEFGAYHTEYRGSCLLTEIQAVLYNSEKDKTIRPQPYYSTGTSDSQFEIVEEDAENFSIRRVTTESIFSIE